MKTIKVLSMALLVLIVIGAHAQEVQKMPEKYRRPIEGVGLPSNQEPFTDIPWFVLSDRANNPIYSSETGSNVVARANFQDEFAVIRISDSGKRLAVANKNDIRNNRLIQGKTILGWMDTDKLLLWNRSIADREYNIDKKAMILFSFDQQELTEEQRKDFRTDVAVMDGPGVSGSNILEYHKGLFQFLPVYKEEGDYLLLGKSLSLDSRSIDNNLRGWVHKDKLSQWSHRVAWERNWEPDAVNERKQNIPVDELISGVMILGDENDARQFSRIDRKRTQFIPSQRTAYEEIKMESKRNVGPMGRFPILDITQIRDQDTEEGNPVKVGVIGDVTDFDGNVIDIQKIYEAYEKRDKLKKINILLVIDATQSMEPYRRSVKTGIENAMTSIKQMYDDQSNIEHSLDSDIGFSFGCVLFRDWAMQDSIQRFGQSLSQDTESLFKWLDENFLLEKNRYRPGVTTDDMEEALFMGMYYAMDFYDLDPNESNYMLLIGDCGDHQDSIHRPTMFVPMGDVLYSLDEFRMNLMAFQVHNGTHPSFDLFQKQIKEIIEMHGGESLVEKKPNLFELPEISIFSGKLLTAPKQGSIDVDQMAKEITQTIQQINEDVNSRVRHITNMLAGYGLESEQNHDIAKAIEDLRNLGFSPEESENILNGMNQEYREGYAVIQSEGYKHPHFKTVVLFEQKELEDLIKAFKDLAIASTYPSSVQRGRLENALNTWFPHYFSGMPREEIIRLPVGKLLEQITGMQFSDLYQNITIERITNPKIVRSEEITVFLNDIKSKLNDLESIYNRRLRYEARIMNPEVDDLFLYIPGDVFKSN